MRLKSTCWDSVVGHNQCAIVFVTYTLKQKILISFHLFLKAKTNHFKMSQTFVMVRAFSSSSDFLDQTVILSYLCIENLFYCSLY